MFNKYGYLGKDIDKIKEENRKEKSTFFEIAFDLNEIAYEILRNLSIDQNDNESIFIGALFCKSIETYNSIVMLSNTGLQSSALSLLRVFVEEAFNIGALVKDRTYFDKFLIRADYDTLELINKIVKNPHHYTKTLVSEIRSIDTSGLQDICKSYKRSDYYSGTLAEKAGMMDLHAYVFHKLCSEIHINSKTIIRYLIRKSDDTVTGIDTIPKYYEQEYVLITAIWTLIREIYVIYEHFKIDDHDKLIAIEMAFLPFMQCDFS